MQRVAGLRILQRCKTGEKCEPEGQMACDGVWITKKKKAAPNTASVHDHATGRTPRRDNNPVPKESLCKREETTIFQRKSPGLSPELLRLTQRFTSPSQIDPCDAIIPSCAARSNAAHATLDGFPPPSPPTENHG